MASTDGSLSLVADGLVFAEGPRWHTGAVYFSDIHDDAVKRVVPGGDVEVVAQLPGSPISIGFTDDGRLLVSALADQAIWEVDDGGEVRVLHDLSSASKFGFGDIVIDPQGRIFIANRGFDFTQGIPEKVDAPIFRIDVDGSVGEVASGFEYPNGLAILPDGRTLVVAETFTHRLLTLEISPDGSLDAPKELVSFAEQAARPDGICCDAESAVWSANAHGHEVVRVARDGTITQRISTGDDMAIGCILGGQDGRDLFVTTATTAYRDEARASRSSRLWTARVDTPGGGRP
jgi:sugar lactone lactonase YvrE